MLCRCCGLRRRGNNTRQGRESRGQCFKVARKVILQQSFSTVLQPIVRQSFEQYTIKLLPFPACRISSKAFQQLLAALAILVNIVCSFVQVGLGVYGLGSFVQMTLDLSSQPFVFSLNCIIIVTRLIQFVLTRYRSEQITQQIQSNFRGSAGRLSTGLC